MTRPPLLFLNVLIVATCGLIYELLAGTLASYVLGDSVTHSAVCIEAPACASAIRTDEASGSRNARTCYAFKCIYKGQATFAFAGLTSPQEQFAVRRKGLADCCQVDCTLLQRAARQRARAKAHFARLTVGDNMDCV